MSVQPLASGNFLLARRNLSVSSLTFGPLGDTGEKKKKTAAINLWFIISAGGLLSVSAFCPHLHTSSSRVQPHVHALLLVNMAELLPPPCLRAVQEPVAFWAVHSLALLWPPTASCMSSPRCSCWCQTKSSGHASVASPPWCDSWAFGVFSPLRAPYSPSGSLIRPLWLLSHCSF